MNRYSTEVDIQTWIETEDTEKEQKRDYNAPSAFFNPDFTVTLMENGVRTVGYQGETLLLQDTLTGLPYIYSQSQIRLDPERMFSTQYDVIDACFYRQFLREGDYLGKGKVLFSTLFTQSALDRYGIDSLHFLDQPIVNYSFYALQNG